MGVTCCVVGAVMTPTGGSSPLNASVSFSGVAPWTARRVKLGVTFISVSRGRSPQLPLSDLTGMAHGSDSARKLRVIVASGT